MFQLQVEPAPAGLAPLGQVVELREMTYGAMRDSMSSSESGQSAERLLGASLYVDGQPIGYEGVRALPARFSNAIAEALGQAMKLHGLQVAAATDAPAADAVPNA
jgi:hypothetical protein